MVLPMIFRRKSKKLSLSEMQKLSKVSKEKVNLYKENRNLDLET